MEKEIKINNLYINLTDIEIEGNCVRTENIQNYPSLKNSKVILIVRGEKGEPQELLYNKETGDYFGAVTLTDPAGSLMCIRIAIKII